jgi:hypothetical protein
LLKTYFVYVKVLKKQTEINATKNKK